MPQPRVVPPACVGLLLCLSPRGPATAWGRRDLLWHDASRVLTPSIVRYAGYVTVDAAHKRELFYWFTESQGDVSSDPLVLWLNGGPGCSSVGGGLMSELGPFFPLPNTTHGSPALQNNPFAWNTVANVIFLEAPAGVGFSVSGDKSDYTTGDAQTAADMLAFMLGFLERFPQFADTPFWITGESYGGHYVPNLAKAIVDHNAVAGAVQINLQGFLVGNAWTNAKDDNTGSVFDCECCSDRCSVFTWRHLIVLPSLACATGWSHSLITEDTYNGVLNSCNMSGIGPLALAGDHKAAMSSACSTYQSDAMASFTDINIYDIYVDVCGARRESVGLRGVGAATPQAHRLLHRLGRSAHDASSMEGSAGTTQAQDLDVSAYNDDGDATGGGRAAYDPCIGSEVTDYLNTPAVQEAIHANVSGTIPYPWSSCSRVVDYSYQDLLTSVVPVYEYLMKAGIEMHVYSGDVDGIVPTTGSKTWISSLGLSVKTPWRQWKTVEGQAGGFVVEYEGLTFATVRNAGHMVPYTQVRHFVHPATVSMLANRILCVCRYATQPGRALHLFSHTINGQPL